MSLSRRKLFVLAAAGAGLPSWPGFRQSRDLSVAADPYDRRHSGRARAGRGGSYCRSRSWRSSVRICRREKPGAGGNVGADYVIHAAPDGYTLLVMISATLPMPRSIPTSISISSAISCRWRSSATRPSSSWSVLRSR